MRGGWAASTCLGARLNLTQFPWNFYNALTRTNLRHGSGKRNGTRVGFLFVIKCWRASLEFPRLEILRVCLFVRVFFFLSFYFPRWNFIFATRLGRSDANWENWAKQQKYKTTESVDDVLQPDNRVTAEVRVHRKTKCEEALHQGCALIRNPNRKSQHNDTGWRWRTFRGRPFR